jgi:ABC-type transporter Mla subunit MlaD
MSEENFRIVVAAAALIACLAFVVQAGIVLALHRIAEKLQVKISGFIEKVEPMLGTVELVLHGVDPVIQKIGPTLDSVNAASAKLGPAIDRFRPVVDQSAVVVARTDKILQSLNQAIATGNQILHDVRPRIAEISSEILPIVRSGREQVEGLGDLLHDVGDRARARLEQVDHAVMITVDQIENLSGTVRSAALRPVHQLNGIAAGISAAVSTIVRGHHSSTVNSAPHDQ